MGTFSEGKSDRVLIATIIYVERLKRLSTFESHPLATTTLSEDTICFSLSVRAASNAPPAKMPPKPKLHVFIGEKHDEAIRFYHYACRKNLVKCWGIFLVHFAPNLHIR